MEWQKIALWLLVIALGGLLLSAWRNRTLTTTAETPDAKVNASNTPENSDSTEGRSYLMYNQGPWAFSPPVNNYLPSMVAPGGIAIMVNKNRADGCFSC